jgi:Arc/MetJ family transcription regulator
MSLHHSADATVPGMRTTLRLDDDLLAELKKRAEREGLSLSELVNLALRQGLASARRRRGRPFRQKTRELGAPSFDVARANAVAAALEDEEVLGKLGGRRR